MSIAIDAALGLNFANCNGVIHFDVKPGNVFLCSDGRAKIGDWGSAHYDEYNKKKWAIGGRFEVRYGAPEEKNGDVVTMYDIWSYALTIIDTIKANVPGSQLVSTGILASQLDDEATLMRVGSSRNRADPILIFNRRSSALETGPEQFVDLIRILSPCLNFDPSLRPSFLNLVCEIYQTNPSLPAEGKDELALLLQGL